MLLDFPNGVQGPGRVAKVEVVSSNPISRSAPFYGAPFDDDGSALRGRFSLWARADSAGVRGGRAVDVDARHCGLVVDLGRILSVPETAKELRIDRLLVTGQFPFSIGLGSGGLTREKIAGGQPPWRSR